MRDWPILEELVFKPEKKRITLITIRTMLRKMMPVVFFRQYSLELKVGLEVDLRELTGLLSLAGYERVQYGRGTEAV